MVMRRRLRSGSRQRQPAADGWTDPLTGALDENSPLYWANFVTNYQA